MQLTGKALGVPVTCSSPKHGCTITLTLDLTHYRKLLKASFKLGTGVTRTLELHFPKAALALIKSRHNHVGGKLTLLITSPGASPYKLVLHPKL